MYSCTKFLIITSVLFFSLSQNVFAQSLTCSKKGLSIIYVNGMMNTPDQARGSRELLESLANGIKPDLDEYNSENAKDFDFPSYYNTSENEYFDFAESSEQVFKQKFGVKVAFKKMAVFILETVKDANTDKDIRAVYEAFLLEKGSYTLREDDELELYKIIKSEIDDKMKKVILVSHSQGNLFANAAYQRLVDEGYEKIALVKNLQVASPAASNAAGGKLITLKNDSITNVPFSQSPTHEVISETDCLNDKGDPLDPIFHNFSKVYLSPTCLSQKFGDLTLKAMSEHFLTELALTAELLDDNCSAPEIEIVGPNSVASHSSANFSVDILNPNEINSDDLTYEWTGSDGATGTSSTFSVGSGYPGGVSAQVKVTDGNGKSASKELSILVVNKEPVGDGITIGECVYVCDSSPACSFTGTPVIDDSPDVTVIVQGRNSRSATLSQTGAGDANFNFDFESGFTSQSILVDPTNAERTEGRIRILVTDGDHILVNDKYVTLPANCTPFEDL